jgi:hypothetical protein
LQERVSKFTQSFCVFYRFIIANILSHHCETV